MRERKRAAYLRQQKVGQDRTKATNLRREPQCSVPSIGFLVDDGIREGLDDRRPNG